MNFGPNWIPSVDPEKTYPIASRHLEIRLLVNDVLPVILSAAKDLGVRGARFFAALRMTTLCLEPALREAKGWQAVSPNVCLARESFFYSIGLCIDQERSCL